MEDVPCNLCGEDLSRLLLSAPDYITGERFTVVECQKCGLQYTNPRPTGQEILRYYPREYFGRGGERFHPLVEALVRRFRLGRMRRLLSQQPPGRALDIGCGRGWLLHDLRSMGWETLGTELSPQAATFARQRLGLDVRMEDIRALPLPTASFDVVILYHTLEHLPEPRQILEEVHRLLKPHGLLVVAVPDAESLSAQLYGPHWFAMDVPRHYYHFSRRTLVQLLNLIGFVVESQYDLSWEFDPFVGLQSCYNALGLTPNYFYDLLRNPQGRIHRLSALQEARNLLLTIILAPLALLSAAVLTVLGPLSRRTCTVEVYARKNRGEG